MILKDLSISENCLKGGMMKKKTWGGKRPGAGMKPGTKLKPERRKKVSVLLSTKEHDTIIGAAELAGKSVSRFIREAALKKAK